MSEPKRRPPMAAVTKAGSQGGSDPEDAEDESVFEEVVALREDVLLDFNFEASFGAWESIREGILGYATLPLVVETWRASACPVYARRRAA